MNLSVIADFADILAAIGVIGSLLFLAFQVRHNTKAVRVQNMAQHFQLVSDRIIASSSRPLDERVATTIDKGKKSFSELSAPEKLTFGAWAFEFIAANNRNLEFGRQGLLDPNITAMGLRNLKWFFKHPGMGEWWREADRQPFPAHLETIIERALSEPQENTA